MASEAEAYRGRLGRHRVVSLGRATAQALGLADGDLVELWGTNAAPLRAWVEVQTGGDAAVALDAFARRVLGVQPGDQVAIRTLRGAS